MRSKTFAAAVLLGLAGLISVAQRPLAVVAQDGKTDSKRAPDEVTFLIPVPDEATVTNPSPPEAIDDQLLRIEPVFGDSRPSAKRAALNPGRPAENRANEGFEDSKQDEANPLPGSADSQEVAANKSAVEAWTPRFMVRLNDARVRNDSAQRQRQTDSDPFAFEQVPASAQQKQQLYTLYCDDMSADLKADESGRLIYSFSCKGKVRLDFGGNEVTGDSLTAVDGTITVTKAVIRTDNQIVMESDSLTLKLKITALNVHPAPNAQAVPKPAAPEEFPLFNDNDLPGPNV